ncbi:DNA-directed RNA polymerase [Strigomonas culicis]|uniref:DNA-directed RNA polymerase n=1 Tax=Strigomonas culicis TaxID=28005 RepID=S9WIV8_9TRYP|nr:DNA-directed RNA polymerase [Strigomonas culicis]EPY30607.1 DNA-directed RNA polymerase [Strigomonas culicis]EPY33228.1 DNA-directed RNA polymerase [Strigomonas culicis]EPY35840.1 DNA-directed RNA polymerase [Strigomonas culicis]|eukprot:EPY20162.1 DNA-directed RNA polymerase [Strigomonas culicis]
MLHSSVSQEGDRLAITPIEERISNPYLSKFEVAKIVGERAQQIVNGSLLSFSSTSTPVLTGGRKGEDLDPVTLAKQDLVNRRIPFVVTRTFPDGRKEHIPLSELLIDVPSLDL